ncbi:MAG TPA: divalent metal cation transporter [Chryseolinea sp.]
MTQARTWKSVVIWSIISAAFIGPGTVTTAVSAGSSFKLDLLWAVTFATLACIVLQEVAARITIASGMNVGQTLTVKFGRRNGNFLKWLIGGSVIAGCAAYEAGNILGAVSGLNLLTGISGYLLTIIVATVSFVLLWRGSPGWISNLMMLLVVIMGISFLLMALTQELSAVEVLSASIRPVIPANGQLLLLGLVGTTVVPYNIFLGSGISKGQTVPMMRVGLAISILIGGLITAFILIAGTAITDFSSFANLYTDFEVKVGKGAAIALALGLFAAGFSSSITAPYASGIIARTVFEAKEERTVKAVWMVVLLTGFLIGLTGVRPIPVILVVQALNGLILPLLVVFLILVSNDRKLIRVEFRHGTLYNVLLLVVLGAVTLISLNNVDKVLISVLSLNHSGHLTIVLILSLTTVVSVGGMIYWKKA